MKEWLINLTLMGLVFIIAILTLEFSLSTFAPNPKAFTTGFYESDKYIGWKGIPGIEKKFVEGRIVSYVKMNSHGFRDRERNYEHEDVFRIVALGDSFIEGLQVPLEKTFPYILEEKLNSEGSSGSPTSPKSQRFEVINLGVSGFGTDQEYITLKHYGLKYKPDFVILNFFIGNDVRNNSLILENRANGVSIDDRHKPFFVLNNGRLEELAFKINVRDHSKDEERAKRGPFSIPDILTKLFPNVYYSVADRINGTPWLADFLWNLGIKKSKPVLDKPNWNGVDIDNYVYAEEYTPEWQNAWEITKALVLKLRDELKMNKVGFLVVVIPNEFEFRADILDKMLETLQIRGLKFDVRKPEGILSKFLEANNIDYLLLRPGFEKYSKETGKGLHFHVADDNHWNADGHALAAQLIYKKLKESHVVPYKGGYASLPSIRNEQTTPKRLGKPNRNTL